MHEHEHQRAETRRLSHSQNFLRSSEFVDGLLDRTDISQNDLVVEIGPGKGVITRELAKRAGWVLAVEVDRTLAEELQAAFTQVANVTIIKADFLLWPAPTESYKIFANIPFNMTADIVVKLLEDRHPPEVAYLIMQDAATKRFIGSPVARNTQMSILLQPWFEMEILTHIDRRRFTPIPSVDAALAAFRKREPPLVEPRFRKSFRDFIIYGYNQWQPTVLDSFKKVFSTQQRTIIAKEVQVMGVKPSDLVIEQWLMLFRSFLVHVPETKKRLVYGAEDRLKEQQLHLSKMHRTR